MNHDQPPTIRRFDLEEDHCYETEARGGWYGINVETLRATSLRDG
jgi:hypothetical protein